jgi:putative endonuclease
LAEQVTVNHRAVGSSPTSGAQQKTQNIIWVFYFGEMMCFVYILYSSRADRYYIGQTDDLDVRLQRHNRGLVRSTKAYLPWDLKYTEVYATRSEAVRREGEIKAKKGRRYIEELLANRSMAESR